MIYPIKRENRELMIAKQKGKTVIKLVEPYIERWNENPVDLVNPYATLEKTSNGIYLEADVKEKFIETVAELGFKQSYVLEGIYNLIVKENE